MAQIRVDENDDNIANDVDDPIGVDENEDYIAFLKELCRLVFTEYAIHVLVKYEQSSRVV